MTGTSPRCQADAPQDAPMPGDNAARLVDEDRNRPAKLFYRGRKDDQSDKKHHNAD
jgi:hypothetical protein